MALVAVVVGRLGSALALGSGRHWRDLVARRNSPTLALPSGREPRQRWESVLPHSGGGLLVAAFGF